MKEDGVEPDCERCEKPELLQENKEALEIAFKTITRGHGAVHMDYEAMRLMIDAYGIEPDKRKTLLDKIFTCTRTLQDHASGTEA